MQEESELENLRNRKFNHLMCGRQVGIVGNLFGWKIRVRREALNYSKPDGMFIGILDGVFIGLDEMNYERKMT